MPALTNARNTVQKGQHAVADYVNLPVKASTVIHQGSLVVIDAGYAAPGRTATGLLAIGRADEYANNASGAAGAVRVDIRRGTFKWGNSSAGDAIAQADVGKDCYIVDDQTVAKTDAAGTRSKAGRIIGIESDGVWVETF